MIPTTRISFDFEGNAILIAQLLVSLGSSAVRPTTFAATAITGVTK